MRLRRNHILGLLKALAVPLLATAVIAAGAGLYAESNTEVPLRADQVELTATIDSAADAVGISESRLYYMNQADLNTAMQQIQDLGITQVRVLLPWREMEPADGTYAWSQADQLLATAKQYGIAVDACVTSTPTWATGYSNVMPYAQPSSAGDYASFVQAVASRYGSSNGTGTGQISSIEVWNEPNGVTGWYPKPNAQGYTDLLKAAYSAIKAVAPGITVVGGVLGAGNTLGDWSTSPVTFLQQMYAAGAAGYFDALSFHPYNASGTFSDGAYYANSALKQLQSLRDLMNANGDIAKLIWATEYGQSSSGQNGEATQSAYIQDFLKTWSTLNGVGPMFLYSLIDDQQGNNMGLFTVAGIAKAAVAMVKAWLTSHPTSTPAESTPGTVVTGLGAAVQALVSAVGSAVKNVVSSFASFLANLFKAFTPKPAATAKVAAAVGITSAKLLAATEVSTPSESTTAVQVTADDNSGALEQAAGTAKVVANQSTKATAAAAIENKIVENKIGSTKVDLGAAEVKPADEQGSTGTETEATETKATEAAATDVAVTETATTDLRSGRRDRGKGHSNGNGTGTTSGSSSSDTNGAGSATATGSGKKDKKNDPTSTGTAPKADKPKSSGQPGASATGNRNNNQTGTHQPKRHAGHN